MNALLIASAASALGDATRVAVYSLCDGRLSVQDIAESVNVTSSTICYHLKVLERAGLVVGAREGRRNCPRRRPERLWQLAKGMSQLSRR
jgi:DNA-binding transcriptional ArsR family regulator